jgi:hypothetical protein
MGKFDSGLIKFLNLFLKSEIAIPFEVTSVHEKIDQSDYNSELKKHFWEVEITSEGFDECDSFKLLEILPKYLKLYGENCDCVTVKSIRPIYQ